MEKILVVDDEKNYLLVMEDFLAEKGYDVLTADNARAALDVIADTDLDLILTDMKMPGLNGIDLIRKIKDVDPDMPVVMMTAFGTVEKAVEAMRAGAYDFVLKPFENEAMLRTIERALEIGRLRRHNRLLRQELSGQMGLEEIIGASKSMHHIFELIRTVAPTKSTVLITGESGTGKELIARAVHQLSPRKDNAFVALNCAAIPETLLESELFGHEKGAFTGATAARRGRFQLADRGTLFLDEVGDIPPTIQIKLLRVLQERSFERVGGTTTHQVDVRILAATNQDLKAAVADARFREDLFYRLNVVAVEVPPLRERPDDIPLLAAHFVEKYGRETGQAGLDLDPRTIDVLKTHAFPGNVRELENIIERAVILCTGDTIRPRDLPADLGRPGPRKMDVADLELPPGASLNQALEGLERRFIAQALDRAGGVQAQAAEALGLTKQTLYAKMKKFNLTPG
ncbi:MAG: sigma-54 dependent transcriptional regulator [Proteobacteria bacterium]|nr:sigma-54 dependent transcriptional regulator [Pseudomonadota bacterium]MBU1740337.1 sigma-54 dependent transcriptional regulator [Pseudomonadota bacterium]